MFAFKVLLFVTLLVNGVLALPTQHLKAKRSFKLPRVEQHNYVPDGSFALRQAYRKFDIGKVDNLPGSSLGTKVALSKARANNGSIDDQDSPSTPQNEAQFLCPVTVGGQSLVLNIDSGSSDMLVLKGKRLT